MSDHEYTPKSKVGKWFNDRLPLLTLANHLTDYPTPKNLNYWWTFGGILTFCLITQIITGIILGMHYVAHADLAFQSVEHIMRDVNYGWLIRYVHANGASMFFLAVYIHIFRSLYYGSYKSPREVIWIIGMLIYFLMMATAFMGYVLPWGQLMKLNLETFFSQSLVFLLYVLLFYELFEEHQSFLSQIKVYPHF